MKMMSAVHPLETPVPARAVGQRDVLSLTLPPMPHLRVAFVRVGANICPNGFSGPFRQVSNSSFYRGR